MFYFHKVAYVHYLGEVDIFSYMSKKILTLYNSAKIIKIDRDFPKLWSQMYCHLFYGSQCTSGELTLQCLVHMYALIDLKYLENWTWNVRINIEAILECRICTCLEAPRYSSMICNRACWAVYVISELCCDGGSGVDGDSGGAGLCRRSVRSLKSWMSTRVVKPYRTKQYSARWRELSVRRVNTLLWVCSGRT